MKTVTFVAEFTGRLASLPNGLRFKPPIPVQEGKTYRLEIDEVNGHTKYFEEPEKVREAVIEVPSASLKLPDGVVEPPHPG
jgi:hypothetical protein